MFPWFFTLMIKNNGFPFHDGNNVNSMTIKNTFYLRNVTTLTGILCCFPVREILITVKNNLLYGVILGRDDCCNFSAHYQKLIWKNNFHCTACLVSNTCWVAFILIFKTNFVYSFIPVSVKLSKSKNTFSLFFHASFTMLL